VVGPFLSGFTPPILCLQHLRSPPVGYRNAFSAADFNCLALKKGIKIAFLRTVFVLATIRFNFSATKDLFAGKRFALTI
jgi:hypothetical protein